MADYPDSDLLQTRYRSGKSKSHRTKHRTPRIQPEYREDLVDGLRASHDEWQRNMRAW